MILLIITGGVIFTLSKTAAAAIGKYPISDCKAVIKSYGSSLEKYAAKEYTTNVPLEAADKPTEYGAFLQCFCK